MVVVMLLMWYFKPDNSSVTGLRAASASSTLFKRASLSVSQPVLSVLKFCFNCSMFSNAVFSSDLAFEVSDCWVLMLALRSLTWDSFMLNSACNMNKIGSIMIILFEVPSTIQSILLGTWGLMHIALFQDNFMMTRLHCYEYSRLMGANAYCSFFKTIL